VRETGTHHAELTVKGEGGERGKLADMLQCKITLTVNGIAWLLSNFCSNLFPRFISHFHIFIKKPWGIQCVNTKYPQCVHEFPSCISSFIVVNRLASGPISTTLPGGYVPSTREISCLLSSKIWS